MDDVFVFQNLIYSIYSNRGSLNGREMLWYSCGQLRKLLLATLAFYFGVWMSVLATLLLMYLPSNALVKAVPKGPNVCVLPILWETRMKFLTLGSVWPTPGCFSS